MIFRINLPAKLALVVLLWVCAFALPWVYQASLCFLVIVGRFAIPAFKPQSERSSKAFSRFLVYSIAVAFFVLLLNSILIRTGSTYGTILGFALYEEGLLFGLRTASRLLLLTYAVLLFFVSTPLKELIRFLQLKGLSPAFTLILLLTLHFLDHLPERIHQIFLAQQARGAPVDAGIFSRSRALLSLLSPLVLSSIVESIDRGTALELRGFLSRPGDTGEARPSDPGWNLLTAFLLLVSILIMLIAIFRWLSI